MQGHAMKKKTSVHDTRDRLIDAAGEMFAEKGFKETTVRDICEKARANVAAVNYHFGDKESLYNEVIRRVIENVWDKFLIEDVIRASDPAEERLYKFVHTFLMRRFEPDRPEWQNILLYQEMMEPRSSVVSAMNEERLKNQETLGEIIMALVGRPLDPVQAMLTAFSVIGQCLFYIMLHSPHSPASEEEKVPMDIEMIETTAKHITEFSIAGINRLKN